MSKTFPYYFMLFFFISGVIWSGFVTDTTLLTMNAIVFTAFLALIWIRKELILTMLHIPIILFVSWYWISCFYAIDVEAAILEASRVSSLIPLSLMITMIPKGKYNHILSLWPWTGAFMVIVGSLFDMSRNGRLESTIQYANALAIILLINILISMSNYTRTKSNITLILLAINSVGLLLTMSRSVWVFWLISVIVLIAITPELRKLKALAYVFGTHLLSLIFAALIKQDFLFFVNRVSSIQTNTSEFQIRLVYWKDSIHMMSDFLIGGSGGGGWTALQHLYQSQDYFVKYIHNHYIQVILDVGIIGGLCGLLFIVFFFWQGIQNIKNNKTTNHFDTKVIILIVTVILSHAAFDFDLIYPLIMTMLLFLILSIDHKNMMIQINTRWLFIISISSIILVVMFTWFAVGYNKKSLGIEIAREGNLLIAKENLEYAEKLLPWSSSILYESAKNDVRLGNIDNKQYYYSIAEDKLIVASAKVPRQKKYSELLKEIRNYLLQ
ncbi:O-antigen ligase family protein [Paenibacillus sp. GSMTC-2017]|uniref:O-antigen ligase family protein n=1 Tax=Paenibacillus sp. GSMTC-2017 TaxID=2794350 RepID=UPI0018D9FA2C|nr:O-antigen ligase family protein [Paenibacillus sp. GSMTC-2017]MBH5319139.1 O-antigen ligase family protein [Paenibacillus sp. GSMTC-2017]